MIDNGWGFAVSQALFQMCSWRLYHQPFQLRGSRRTIILQTSLFAALQGEGKLQSADEGACPEGSCHQCKRGVLDFSYWSIPVWLESLQIHAQVNLEMGFRRCSVQMIWICQGIYFGDGFGSRFPRNWFLLFRRFNFVFVSLINNSRRLRVHHLASLLFIY